MTSVKSPSYVLSRSLRTAHMTAPSICESLASGLVHPLSSPVGAGFFFVKKKDGTPRPCIDIRVLMRSPPGINTLCLSQMLCSRIVLCDMLNTFLFIYLDDILFFSENEENMQRVRLVLIQLLENKLFVKAEKCEFHATTVSFLGFIIKWEQLSPDPVKVQAVAEWPTPSEAAPLCSASYPGGALPNIIFVFLDHFSSKLGCHAGLNRTLYLPCQRFWWPSMVRNAKGFTTCPVCTRGKSSHQSPTGLLQPLSIPRRPQSHIAVDFVTHLPPFDGHTVVLTFVDRFQKSAHFILLPKLPSAAETGDVLVRHVSPRHPLRHCFRSRAAIHLSRVVFFLRGSRCYGESFLRLPSPV